MSNEYFTHNDKPYAENLNDSVLLIDAWDLTIPVSLPEHYENKHFNSTTGIVRKAGVALVTMLDVGSGINIDDTSIDGSGDLTFRVYPNFNQFYRWSKVGWTATGEITVDLSKKNGTVILTDVPNNQILSDYAELKQLQEIDVVLHFNNAELSDITFYFENNHTVHSRPSALLQQENVENLVDDLAGKEILANKVSVVDDDSDHYPNCEAVADALDLKEDKANKRTTVIDSDDYYPSSKAVYDQLALKEDVANKKDTITNSSTHYPSNKAVYDESQWIRGQLSEKEDKSNKTNEIDAYESHYPSNRAIYPLKISVDALKQEVSKLTELVGNLNSWEMIMNRQGVVVMYNQTMGIGQVWFDFNHTFGQAEHDYKVTSVALPSYARPFRSARAIGHAYLGGLTVFSVSSDGFMYVRRSSANSSSINVTGSLVYGTK